MGPGKNRFQVSKMLRPDPDPKTMVFRSATLVSTIKGKQTLYKCLVFQLQECKIHPFFLWLSAARFANFDLPEGDGCDACFGLNFLLLLLWWWWWGSKLGQTQVLSSGLNLRESISKLYNAIKNKNKVKQR